MRNGLIHGILSLLLRLRYKYDKICQDNDTKAHTAYFGIYSIVITLFFGALFTLGILALSFLFRALEDSSLTVFVIVPLIIIVALAEIASFAQYIFGGMLGVVYQLKCNRRPIGFIALVVFIAASIGMAIGIYFIMANTVL